MIAGTYLASAALLMVVAFLFNAEQFSDWGFVAALGATFFFASAGASSAYLTVSEVFPMEVRALAIAFFYAIGTAIGGITGPLVFERLAATGDTSQVMVGYLVGSAVMAFGGIVEILLGVRAEQRSLEDIAKPLTAEEAEREGRIAEREEPGAAAGRRFAPAAEAMGWRRFRPGPGRTSYSPLQPWPPESEGPPLDREVDALRRVLDESGPTTRRDLYRLAGGRYWGPGRFSEALRAGIADGAIVPAGRSRYALGAPAGDGPRVPQRTSRTGR
jgi:MFS family permease